MNPRNKAILSNGKLIEEVRILDLNVNQTKPSHGSIIFNKSFMFTHQLGLHLDNNLI